MTIGWFYGFDAVSNGGGCACLRKAGVGVNKFNFDPPFTGSYHGIGGIFRMFLCIKIS